MARDVIMPALGMAQESGVLIRWLVPEGGSVAEGDPLMEVETDKAVVEVPATASGTLAAVAYGEGAEVSVGTVLAVLLAPGESLAGTAEDEGRPVIPATAEAPALVPATPPTTLTVAAAPVATPAPPSAAGGPPAAVLASPKAKRLARERGLDLAGIAGSGPAGAVRSVDLPTATSASAPRPGRPTGAPAAAEPASRAGVAWLRAPIDTAGLREFVERVSVDTADVLTRVVVASIARHVASGSRAVVVHLSVHDASGGLTEVVLRGPQLGSMLTVAAARAAAAADTARDATGTVGAARAAVVGEAHGHETVDPIRVDVVDRSAEPFERSESPWDGDADVRLTLAPVADPSFVHAAEPGTHGTATLRLDYRAAGLDETRAAALLTYVGRLLGDPFALAVHG